MPGPPEGMWEVDAPTDSKVTGIHAILLYTGKVLLFHCRSYPFWSRIYDPVTNSMSMENQVVPDWPYLTDAPIEPSAIFCSGHCALPDGRILVAGGERVRPYLMLLSPGCSPSEVSNMHLSLIRQMIPGALLDLLQHLIVWRMDDGIQH